VRALTLPIEVRNGVSETRRLHEAAWEVTFEASIVEVDCLQGLGLVVCWTRRVIRE